MLGGYLDFFMKPAVAEMYQTLKKELDELIQSKVSFIVSQKFSALLLCLFSVKVFQLC